MKKVYLNKFNDKALYIDEDAKTYALLSAKTAQAIRFEHREGFIYRQSMRFMLRMFKQLKARGFKKALRA